MDYLISLPELDEALRLLGKAAPQVASDHMLEAVARGLGFGDVTALRAAAIPGGRFTADRLAFEASLANRGYRVIRLQVTLLPDALRIAAGMPWQIGTKPEGAVEVERCGHCRDNFWSFGPHNLICVNCKLRGGSVPGVHHAEALCDHMVYDAFHTGIAPDYDNSPLRARPGWADILDGPALRARVGEWLSYREAVRAHRWQGLPDGQKFLIDTFGEQSYLRLFRWSRPFERRRAA